jgi:hypothetical protein
MKYEEIQSLLDRYWEGETSLEEERALKAYFSGAVIDDRLKAVAPLFKAIKEEQQVELKTKAKSVQIRPQLYYWAAAASVALLMLAGWWMMKQEIPQAPMAELPSSQPPATTPMPSIQPEEPIAAISPQPPIVNKKPMKRPAKASIAPQKQEIDPETAMAMAEIKAALALVSAKLDKGKKQAVQKASYLEVVEKLPRKTDG